MLTGITTRTSTPQEDAEPWPGGSARPVLDHLTATLGMTGTDARELLKAARTAQAEGGPGTLADYPLPSGGAHLLIHYAPGTRAYRLKLTTLQNEAPPGTGPQPGTAPGNDPAPDGPPRGQETPDASPPGHGDGTPAPALPAPAGRGGTAGAGEDHGHDLAQRRPRRRRPSYRHAGRLPARRPDGPRLRLPGQPRRADAGADRRRGVRHLQRPPPGPRRSRPGLRLLRAQAPVAIIPRKLTVLRQVVLPSPLRRAARTVGAAGRADALRASGRYEDVAPMTDRLSQRPVPPFDPPERFAVGDVVAAVRCPVDVSTLASRTGEIAYSTVAISSIRLCPADDGLAAFLQEAEHAAGADEVLAALPGVVEFSDRCSC
jgi:hypothetical protein